MEYSKYSIKRLATKEEKKKVWPESFPSIIIIIGCQNGFLWTSRALKEMKKQNKKVYEIKANTNFETTNYKEITKTSLHTVPHNRWFMAATSWRHFLWDR